MSSTPARWKLLAVVAAAAMMLAACGSDPEDGGGQAGEDDQPEGGGTELLVEAHDFRFEVQGATLGEPGQDVTVRFENQGEAPHTFSSEEVDLDIEADPGGDGEGTFTVPDDGNADFVCNIHPQMTITLTSGEPATDTGSGDGETDDGSEDTGSDYDY